MSVKTAGDGSAFTTDAIDLCDFLLREDATPEELEEYISEMQETAKSAHEAATESSNKFRFVHRDLSQVSLIFVVVSCHATADAVADHEAYVRSAIFSAP